MNSNGRISAPVTTADVCNVLGVSDHRLSYLFKNTHGRINMWSRYKPVPSEQTKFDDKIISLNGYSSWEDKPQGPLSKPWYKGGTSSGMYTPAEVNTINQLMNSDGTPNTNSIWTYTPWRAGCACRIGDFVGYNHNARCPLSAYVNYTPARDLYGDVIANSVEITGNIFSGFNNTTGWDDPTAVKYAGEITLDDVFESLPSNQASGLYLCIVIRNNTQNTIRFCSKSSNILTEDGKSFSLDVSSSSAIEYGGMGHTVKVGDVLDIGVYLSITGGSSSQGSSLFGGYSLYTGSDSPHVCRRVTVVNEQKQYEQYKILYDVVRFEYDAEGYLDELYDGNPSGEMYVNIDELKGNEGSNTNRVQRGISNISAAIQLKKMQYYNKTNKQWQDTSAGIELKISLNLRDYLEGVMDDGSQGESFFGINITSKDITGADITSNTTLSGNVSPQFNSYHTQQHAANRTNAIVARGIPAPYGTGNYDNNVEVKHTLTVSGTVASSALWENAKFTFEKSNSTASSFMIYV